MEEKFPQNVFTSTRSSVILAFDLRPIKSKRKI